MRLQRLLPPMPTADRAGAEKKTGSTLKPRQRTMKNPPLAVWMAAFAVVSMAALSGCAVQQEPAGAKPGVPESAHTNPAGDSYLWLNRITWGATSSLAEQTASTSLDAFVVQQLRAGNAKLPEVVNSQIQAMTITQRSVVELTQALEQQRKDADATMAMDAKKAAQQAYQQELTRLAREAATRHVLRALYSSNQIQEQMTWFWLNHFSVYLYKSNVRAMLGDYEDTAIRPHALGNFRDLLAAVTYHPVMLRYLDNEQNAAGRINENFARELMELHTLGVDGGYSQADVQELARVLTGAGVNLGQASPNLKRELQPFYVRRGQFEFNPARHDFGDKQFLGSRIRGKGIGEIDEALDRLSKHPSTARFISRKLAQFWLQDDPPAPLVNRLSSVFLSSDGDVGAVLRALFNSAEFAQPAGRKFKDPMRYVISAVRLAYDDKPILNAGPVLNWLNRMGEPLYGRQTPDGYPLSESAWASPGQMTTRFEVAKAIGSGNAGLFRPEGQDAHERAAFPQLSNALYYRSIQKTLSPKTRQALEQATSAQEWNTFLLSSPEMMTR